MKSPTGEDPSGLELDRQLGGGVLPIRIERLWEEEITVR
jgi:hypothetical protein